MYVKTLYAGWGEMDFNGHLRNTAYLDKSGDVRMMFFAEHGFPMSEFQRLRLGPVVMKDRIDYQREVGLLQKIEVSLCVAGLAEDGSRFMLRNDFRREDGKNCARVTSTGGWLDLAARKLVAPPEALLHALFRLERSEDFVELPSSLK